MVSTNKVPLLLENFKCVAFSGTKFHSMMLKRFWRQLLAYDRRFAFAIILLFVYINQQNFQKLSPTTHKSGIFQLDIQLNTRQN